MSERIRLYTFKVTCPLPKTRKGEPRIFTSYIYGMTDQGAARAEWFKTRLRGAKKNGLRGKEAKLRDSLALTIERVTINGDPRLAAAFAK
jgi:hypothetical protein